MLEFAHILANGHTMAEEKEQEGMQEQELTQHLIYWQEQLDHSSELLHAPDDDLQPGVKSTHKARISFVLTEDLSREVRAFSRHEQTTLYVCLLSTFQAILHSYTGQTDLMLASPMTFCRPEQTHINILQNTLVLRTNLANNPSFRELLHRTDEVVSQARTHHTVPYDIQLQQIRPASKRKPGVRVAFSLEGTLPTLLPNWTTSVADVRPAADEFDLSLVLDNRLAGLSGYIEYNVDLFEKATIERMQGLWESLLASIIRYPALRLSDFAPF